MLTYSSLRRDELSLINATTNLSQLISLMTENIEISVDALQNETEFFAEDSCYYIFSSRNSNFSRVRQWYLENFRRLHDTQLAFQELIYRAVTIFPSYRFVQNFSLLYKETDGRNDVPSIHVLWNNEANLSLNRELLIYKISRDEASVSHWERFMPLYVLDLPLPGFAYSGNLSTNKSDIIFRF